MAVSDHTLINAHERSSLNELEMKIFAAEFTAVDERMCSCSFWLDYARFRGDGVVFNKLQQLQSALRTHRDFCRNILVSSFVS